MLITGTTMVERPHFMETFVTLECEGRSVAAVTEPIDMSNCGALHQAAKAVLERCPLIVDLSRCSYIDSMGLGVLLKLYRSYGRRLTVVVDPSSEIAAVFEITEMYDVLPMAPTLDAAIRS